MRKQLFVVVLAGLLSPAALIPQGAAPQSCAKECARLIVLLCTASAQPGTPPQAVQACQACLNQLPDCGGNSAAEITNPPNGSTLQSSPAAFSWNAGANMKEFELLVGTSPADGSLLTTGFTPNQSASAK